MSIPYITDPTYSIDLLITLSRLLSDNGINIEFEINNMYIVPNVPFIFELGTDEIEAIQREQQLYQFDNTYSKFFGYNTIVYLTTFLTSIPSEVIQLIEQYGIKIIYFDREQRSLRLIERAEGDWRDLELQQLTQILNPELRYTSVEKM